MYLTTIHTRGDLATSVMCFRWFPVRHPLPAFLFPPPSTSLFEGSGDGLAERVSTTHGSFSGSGNSNHLIYQSKTRFTVFWLEKWDLVGGTTSSEGWRMPVLNLSRPSRPILQAETHFTVFLLEKWDLVGGTRFSSGARRPVPPTLSWSRGDPLIFLTKTHFTVFWLGKWDYLPGTSSVLVVRVPGPSALNLPHHPDPFPKQYHSFTVFLLGKWDLVGGTRFSAGGPGPYAGPWNGKQLYLQTKVQVPWSGNRIAFRSMAQHRAPYPPHWSCARTFSLTNLRHCKQYLMRVSGVQHKTSAEHSPWLTPLRPMGTERD